MIRFLCILALLSALLPLTAAERGFVPIRRAAGDHVALIIGNGAYPDVPLANPVNDAVDVGRAFESIGFQVTVVNDADKAQMLQAIQTFGDRLAKAKAAVFYYAGHGVQVGGSNWLLPVARQVGEIINREDEVRLRAVDANEVLVAMERAKVPVAMVILDACRNNPFKGAGRSGAKGLAQLDAPPGSLVVYATAPGQVAADGNGRNSPFSHAFVTQLLIPGQEVESMLRNVKKGVRESTQGVQVPWSSSSMTDTFTFVPAVSQDEEKAMKQAQLAGLTQQAEAIAKAEASAAAKRQVEEAALAAKQAEVDKLNAQIEDMKKKVNSGDPAGAQPGDGGGLKAMLAVVRQKEAQQKELVEMQKKADEARQARVAEIARMKAKETQENRDREQKRLTELTSDLKDYREISGSDFGKDMAQSAWDEVLKKWGLAAGSVRRDDVATLETRVAPGIGAERAAAAAAAAAAADRTAEQAFADGGRRALEGFAAQYPQHVRAAEARRQASLIPAWASGVGKDASGTWAKLVVGGQTQVLRLIPAGTFTMGSDANSDEKPAHQIALSAFWLGDSEVTQGLWQAVMGSNPSKFTGAANPVEQVSWDDCHGFFQKLNGQVTGLRTGFPTEAQWEYACRAGTTGDYAGDLDAMAWYDKNAGGTTHPVKTKQANAFGLFDMHGNVWEWCADWYAEAYTAGSQRDPSGPSSGSRRVIRGGSVDRSARNCRSALRLRDTPDIRYGFLGFRIAAQATP